MSGHNKWSTIKHKKGKADAARGQLFSKLVKEITAAAREGGGDPETNARLRAAVDAAKASNMPSENIERAVKRGTGEIEGVVFEEMQYEAYGPGGVAILIDILTDNRNRTAAEVRHILSRGGGRLGAKNSVAYLFNSLGQIYIDGGRYDEDRVMEAGLEAGVEDVQTSGDTIVVTTSPADLYRVKASLESAGIEVESAEVAKVAASPVIPSEKEAEQAARLMEILEEHDDVQAVHTNLEMPT
ncbi:YebC/PmpR family DNA-binding transcriptional regulator [Candidatus Fermentibacteria bacterium]|nr:YebC/PmpR family DNA-binding transcriptional regulator [Candidatus Fermentibacteria bacterium]